MRRAISRTSASLIWRRLYSKGLRWCEMWVSMSRIGTCTAAPWAESDLNGVVMTVRCTFFILVAIDWRTKVQSQSTRHASVWVTDLIFGPCSTSIGTRSRGTGISRVARGLTATVSLGVVVVSRWRFGSFTGGIDKDGLNMVTRFLP